MGKGRTDRAAGETEEALLDLYISRLKAQSFEGPISQMQRGWEEYKNRLTLDAALAVPLRDADDRLQDHASLTVMVAALCALANDVDLYLNPPV